MLSVVARGLAGFGRDTAFVGGAAVALHVTDAAAPPPRPTDDVDVVVEIVSRLDFHKSEEALRSLGFRRSVAAGGSICRWQYKGLNVDIMPTDAAALGFHNRWYADGLRAAEDFPCPTARSYAPSTSPPCSLPRSRPFSVGAGATSRPATTLKTFSPCWTGPPRAR
ncbi:MAG: hypothetical protein IPL30_05635 [Elusimicrobia bacterium]|nr:hypothetical protein [Elusimicrobiota bacterium]